MSRSYSIFVEILRYVLPIGILAAAAVGFWALQSLRSAPAQVEREETPVRITTSPLLTHQRSFAVEVDGLVVPHREVELSAEVAGRIVYKSEDCRPGRYVRRLDDDGNPNVLLQIDPQPYQLEVERLQKQRQQAIIAIQELNEDLEGTQDLIALAEQDLELQQNDLRRTQSLVKDEALAETELDRAKLATLASRNNLLKLRNQARLMDTRQASLAANQQVTEVQLERAELDLSRTKITVPRDGVVVREMVERDSYVAPGTPLVALEDTAKAEVRCNLRLEHLYWLWRTQQQQIDVTKDEVSRDYELPEAEARITYSLEGQQFVWKARLSRYDGIGLDERTRTVPCRLLVDDPRTALLIDRQGHREALTGPPALIRGMFVTVEIDVPAQTDVYRVPETALRPGKVVWIVRDQRLHKVPVQLVKLVEVPAESMAAGNRRQPDDSPAGDDEQPVPDPTGAELRVRYEALIHARDDALRAGDAVVVTAIPEAVDGMNISDWEVR